MLRLFRTLRVSKTMPFRLLPIALLILSGCAMGQEAPPVSVAEQYLFSAANTERSILGLPMLRWDESLYRAADGHAREMASRKSISHQYPGEAELTVRGKVAGAHFSKISENVAESPDVVTMQSAWMHSPGHKANLLDPEVDSVGIRVVSRSGELYAVEDFDRSVMSLSLDEQEREVAAALQANSTIEILVPSEESRHTCAMASGYASARQPGFVIRYTSADLTKVPKILLNRVASGRYLQAMVGACGVETERNFTTYSVAVMLFP